MPPRKAAKTEFEPKSMVLSKMTGFPAWPSFVMPPDMIPAAIMKAKKKTTNTCVIFIPDGDFNWMNEKGLEVLTPAKLETYLSKVPKDKLKNKSKKKTGRTNNVAEAYIAAKGLQFDEFMEELAAVNKGVAGENDEDEDEEEEEVDENGDDANDTNDANANEEGAEIENEESDSEAKSKPLPKTRRRGGLRNASNNSRNGNGVAQSTLEEDGNEDEIEDESDSSRSRKRTRRGSASATKKRVVSNSSVNEETNGSGNGKGRSASPKPIAEKDRQHQLWLCRIKLQRSLIQRNQPATPKDPKLFPPPTVEELLVARLILHRLADFPLNVELLRETKIHKVLKCILKDEDLAYDESFKLHEKCNELLDKWADMIESLKLEKQAKYESRLSSQAPEDPETSKKLLKGESAEKL